MKIGVALSGCDIGGVSAYAVLRELEAQGFEIAMVSASGLPSIAALLYAFGCDWQDFYRIAERFLQDCAAMNMDMAIAGLAEAVPVHRYTSMLPFVISAVGEADGRICAFSGEHSLVTARLQIVPLQDAYDALSAAVSPADGLASYAWEGLRLCDFSLRYGSPVYPLYMAGLSRIVSVSFVPQHPQSLYEGTVKQNIADSAHFADVHLSLAFEAGPLALQRYIDAAIGEIRSRMEATCMKILF